MKSKVRARYGEIAEGFMLEFDYTSKKAMEYAGEPAGLVFAKLAKANALVLAGIISSEKTSQSSY